MKRLPEQELRKIKKLLMKLEQRYADAMLKTATLTAARILKKAMSLTRGLARLQGGI